MADFKSENDDFDEREFTKNEIRVDALYLQKTDVDKRDILNLFICSYKPAKFFKQMREQGCPFKQVKGRKWLWQAKVGLQNVAVVVCRDLPFEEKYFDWIAFASTNTLIWQKLVTLMIEKDIESRLLQYLLDLRRVEVVKIMSKFIDDLIAQGRLTPEYVAQLKEQHIYANRLLLKLVREKVSPEEFAEIFNWNELLPNMSIEERLAGIPAEERLAGIPAEERLAGIKPEELVSALSPDEEERIFKLLIEKRAQKNGNGKE